MSRTPSKKHKASQSLISRRCVSASVCVLAILLTLLACGGSSSPPSTTATPPTSAAGPTLPPAPPPTSPPPPPAPAQPTQLLYAVTQSTSTGSVYTAFKVGSDGSLSPLGTALQTTQPTLIRAADPNGHYLFGFKLVDPTSATVQQLLTFTVQPATGALQQTSTADVPLPSGATAIEAAVNPAGTFMFIAMADAAAQSSLIVTYSIDSSGKLKLVPTASGSPGVTIPVNALTVNPAGNFLYAADFNIGTTVSQFAIDSTGHLSQVSALSLPSVGAGVETLAMARNGSTLYVGLFSTPAVLVLSVDPSTGKLTDMGTVCACVGNSGFGSGQIAFNAKGTVLFQAIGGETADGVALYSVNQSTGALTSLSSSFLTVKSAGVPSFALDASGNFLYAAGPMVDEILGFSVTDAGVLTTLPGFPLKQTGADDLFMVNFKP